ncbi:MAG: tyrosine-type recombinase/integrase [Anaerolineales bacterium]|jgi:site-specific recombinase XerD
MDNQFDDLPLFSHGGPRIEAERESHSALGASSSLSAAINAWGKALENQGRSIHTVKAFTGDLRLVAKYLGGGQPLQQISTSDLKNFLDWMLNHRNVPCSPKTYARRITSIKAFYRWLVEEGILSKDPADPIPQQSVISPLPDVLTQEEMAQAVEAAQAMRQGKPPDARPYTLLTLLLETGIKKGECLNIHLNNIDLESEEGPILYVRYGRVSKRYKERKIPLSGEWVAAYREYVQQYKPDDRLFPWSPRRLEYLLEEIGEAAGLKKHISFDMCRWSSALQDTLEGVESDTIRQKLGISKIQWREVGNKLARLADQVEA